MPDLLAGTIVTGLDTPPPASDAQAAFLSPNVTSTAYAAGAPVCGAPFVAPTTGRVTIWWSAWLDNTTAGGGGGALTFVSIRVGTGGAVGGGTELLTPTDDESIANDGQAAIRASTFYLMTGLTPGLTYNVQLMHRVSGGSGAIARRRVLVLPST